MLLFKFCVNDMWFLSKTFICLIVFLAKSINCFPLQYNFDVESDDEYNVIIKTALFGKINIMIIELKNITQHFKLFRQIQYSQNKNTKDGLDALKLELRQFLSQNEVTTANLVAKMQQEVADNFEGQKNFMKKTLLSADDLQLYEDNKFKHNRNWQIILRRQDGSLSFNRSWLEYKLGFGDINGNYFIGLESLHAITTYSDPQELLIVLQDFDNKTRYAKYSDFVIGSENEKYKIVKLGSYQGDAGDSFTQHFDFSFSTYDQDNDNTSVTHCANKYQGGWWFSNCFSSHLTGVYLYQPLISNETGNGIIWYSWHGLQSSLKYVAMMIRPK